MRISDWSSDVCSSDLHLPRVLEASQRRRFLDGGEVEYRLNRPDLLELGFQPSGTVALLVQVKDHDTLALLGQMPRDLTGKRGLADAPARISHYNCSRSVARRVGQECVRTCRSRWSLVPSQKKT